jgi:hypothetical protein
MRAPVIALLGSLLLFACVHQALAKDRTSGTPPSRGIGFGFRGIPRPGEPCSTWVRIYRTDQYARADTGEVWLELPDGVHRLAGDLRRRVSLADRLPDDNEWPLVLRFSRLGRFEVRGWFRAELGGRDGRFETDFVQLIDVRADTILYEPSHPTRYESVLKGQRYRYGGWIVKVPIDSSEAVLQNEISPRALVLKEEVAVCRHCQGDFPVQLPFYAFVGPDGTLRGAQIARDINADQGAIDAAREALTHWKFTPAEVKGRPVTDYVFVRVEVRQEG